MANAPRPMAGKNARVSVGTGPTYIAAEEWSSDGEDSKPDTSNTEGGGFTDVITGMLTRITNIKGYWDAANNPHASPPNLLESKYLEAFKLYYDTSNVLITYPTCMVTAVRLSMQVKDKILLDFTVQNKGSYTVSTT